MAHELTRRSTLSGGLALTLGAATSGKVARAQTATTGIKFAGVNIAGGEFGGIPGTVNKDYAYPARATIDYYSQAGFNTIRVPFKWERLQPALNQPFASSDQSMLVGVVDYAVGKGMNVLLDPHNYARRRVPTDGWKTHWLIGSEGVPTAAFADFWSRLATLFKNRASVLFGLMNEPYGIAPQTWLGIANAAMKAIRDTGATNLVLVPGIAYTGAHSWLSMKNDVMGGIVDPGHNFAFEVHQYFDSDSSGTKPIAMSATVGSDRIKAFQTWARNNHFRGFLGEFAAASDQTSLSALEDICRTMEANSDVWLGWTAWAGGGWWPPNYMFNLEPSGGQMRPQTRILSTYAKHAKAG
jgi:endoglucanase